MLTDDDRNLIRECLKDRYSTLKQARDDELRAAELRYEAAKLDKKAAQARHRVKEFTMANLAKKFLVPASTIKYIAGTVKDNHMSRPEKQSRKRGIYDALVAGKKTPTQIAREHGVSRQYVWQIQNEI